LFPASPANHLIRYSKKLIRCFAGFWSWFGGFAPVFEGGEGFVEELAEVEADDFIEYEDAVLVGFGGGGFAEFEEVAFAGSGVSVFEVDANDEVFVSVAVEVETAGRGSPATV
jgi:hypothetical protein